MSLLENFSHKIKEFGPTTWAIKNKTTMYLLMLFVTLIGVTQFITLPKERFPDIVIPQVVVQTIYVGNSPHDIENLVTKPIEKQLKGISGVKVVKTESTSMQDFSVIVVEFATDVKIDVAVQKVKDAVDKSRQDLPNDLTQEPTVMEINISDMPIMYVNVSGNYDVMRLKEYADDIKDKLEEDNRINRIDLVGAPEREFQVNVDPYRMQSANLSYDDIANAIARENMDISGGLLDVGNMKRTLQLKGQFKTAEDISQVILRNTAGAPINLKDIAVIKDTIKDAESYARLNGKNVITLNIIKRSGENLIETSDGVRKTLEELKASDFPKDLNVVVTGDSSVQTKSSFNELVNSIIIGFILVLIILMFFMGITNAFFVALSVPLSMFVAFLFLPLADMIVGANVTLNFMVLFALLFGLGIIVDDAIVVIENTHRIFMEGGGKISSEMSARVAAGEVFVPVLAGTVTTLAPFVPLLFWPGIVGKFMVYLPTMLIFTLTASLIVAFIMNPVFAVDFMNHEDDEEIADTKKGKLFRNPIFWAIIGVGVLLVAIGFMRNANEVLPLVPVEQEGLRPGGIYLFFGNILLFFALLMILNRYFIQNAITRFQSKWLPGLMNRYERLLRWALAGRRPVGLVLSTVALFFLTILFFSLRKVPVVFFPGGDPNFIYVYLKLPVGTSVEYTDSVTRVLEAKVNQVLNHSHEKPNPIVESVIANVAIGATEPNSGALGTSSERGRVQVSFVEFEKRHGAHTKPYLDKLRETIKGIPGAEISVDQERNGPPTEPPVNIEIASEDMTDLIRTATGVKNFLDSVNIPGVEELKMNTDIQSPEITLNVDRQRALLNGVSTAQIGMAIRTALFGREASKIKDEDDEYKIQIRNLESDRKSLTDLLNMELVMRDMATGQVKRIPLSSVVSYDLTNTLGSVKRKNHKRVISIQSNVLTGHTPTEVNAEIESALKDFNKRPDGVSIKQTGEGEQQAETGAFLMKALVIALVLILFTLVLQFNSISKPMIILTEVIFSVIGVLLGFAITGMTFSVVMSGMGIVGLAGIVVKNGILVIEFADELRARGMRTREAVIQAGKTRIIPVLLTALAAILAFIPIAVGFNINFITMFAEYNPRIFFGGDNVTFWKPLSWTIIFGLTFAFFMTLLIVPAMYIISERLKRPMQRYFGGKWVSFLSLPPFTPIFILMIVYTIIRHKREVNRRNRRLPNESETWNGSWF